MIKFPVFAPSRKPTGGDGHLKVRVVGETLVDESAPDKWLIPIDSPPTFATDIGKITLEFQVEVTKTEIYWLTKTGVGMRVGYLLKPEDVEKYVKSQKKVKR